MSDWADVRIARVVNGYIVGVPAPLDDLEDYPLPNNPITALIEYRRRASEKEPLYHVAKTWDEASDIARKALEGATVPAAFRDD